MVSKRPIFKKKGGLKYWSNMFGESFHHPVFLSKNIGTCLRVNICKESVVKIV